MNASSLDAILLDLSGVLYEGRRLLPGAGETVTWARSQGFTLRFVTNTATESSAAIRERLVKMGIDIAETELFTAPLAAKTYIQQANLRPYCLVHPALTELFADLDTHHPNCVVLGDAREHLSYENLNRAFRLCMEGAELIGIGLNKYFKDDEGLKLDAGPYIKALEWAAGTEAVIMGKPSKVFFDQVVASTHRTASACLMVGDDIEGDVIGAVNAGLNACLVRTGKFRQKDEGVLPSGAGIIDSIAKLKDWMLGG